MTRYNGSCPFFGHFWVIFWSFLVIFGHFCDCKSFKKLIVLFLNKTNTKLKTQLSRSRFKYYSLIGHIQSYLIKSSLIQSLETNHAVTMKLHMYNIKLTFPLFYCLLHLNKDCNVIIYSLHGQSYQFIRYVCVSHQCHWPFHSHFGISRVKSLEQRTLFIFTLSFHCISIAMAQQPWNADMKESLLKHFKNVSCLTGETLVIRGFRKN